MSIANAVASASAYLTEHPDEARYRDSQATATLDHGLVVAVRGPGGESARTDMPTGIGGTATVPSPGWLLRAATASCVASLVAIRAAATGATLEHVEITVDSESDDRGILGLDPDIPAGALSMKVVADVRARRLDGAATDALVQWAVDHCPVLDTVRRAIPVEVVTRGAA
jgi:uncharacterized OsmC-like protein